MLRSPPRLLWKYTLGDLWRRLALSAVVLVTIIAFAAAIKPLADGRLDALDALRFVVLAMPPMLAYALPFAGGFAATLVYYRLATDNEITAAQAGGVSLRALLTPAILTGLLCAATLVALNEQIIPRFLRGMQNLVAADAARLLATSIEKGHAVDFKGMQIYADQAQVIPPEPGSGARDQLLLRRLAVIRRDREGKIVSDVTASRAVAWLYPADRFGSSGAGWGNAGSREGTGLAPEADADALGDTAGDTGTPMTRLCLRLSDVDGTWAGRMKGSSEELTIWQTVPGAFDDDPKFLTWRELIDLRARPENMNWIDLRRRDLAHRLAEEKLWREVDRRLKTDGVVELGASADESWVVRGAGLERDQGSWRVVPADGSGRVEAERRTSGSGRALARLSAERVWLSSDIGGDRAERRLDIRLDLENVRTLAAIGSAEGNATATGEEPTLRAIGSEVARRQYAGLMIEPNPVQALADEPGAKLITTARALKATPGGLYLNEQRADELAQTVDEFAWRLSQLDREITSKQHERMALAAACCLMIVTGAVTAVRLRSKLPLQVYLWSFFPALASLVTISGGQQLTHENGWPGLLLLWGGVGGLGVYTILVYISLSRH
ncbi:MAG: LptF/LptG family permease [Planctomycetota bacterium]|nr:LptF/LptG family permease [Planctomycetota bacterium]